MGCRSGLWGIHVSFARWRIAALGLLIVVLGGVQVVKWSPRYWSRWPAALHPLIENPSAATPSNHEWSLGFVDILRDTQTLGRKLDKRAQPGQRVGGDWPFNVYLCDPRFGVVKKPHPMGNPGYPNWWENRGGADFIVVRNCQPFHEPLPYAYPGAKGLERIKYRTRAVGSLALFQFHPAGVSALDGQTPTPAAPPR